MPMAPAPDLLQRFRGGLSALGCTPEPTRPIGIAVSGGPDSLALLLLAHAALPDAVTAATVDHGLRAEAAEEARGVARLCARIGVPHAILTPEPGALAGGGSVQARARALRYRLLGRWADEAGADWVATAHHVDDQAETFLMRAARGAGLAGLAGVRGQVTIAGMAIVRPLLGWRRRELADIVAEQMIEAVDDPSNRDPAHDRTAFRALLAHAPRLAPARLARVAANLAEAEDALAWAMAALAPDRLRDEGDTLRLVDPHTLPREFRRRLVAAAIAQLTGAGAVRGDAVDRMVRLLDSGRAATLAGIQAKAGADWLFSAAPPRRR